MLFGFVEERILQPFQFKLIYYKNLDSVTGEGELVVSFFYNTYTNGFLTGFLARRTPLDKIPNLTNKRRRTETKEEKMEREEEEKNGRNTKNKPKKL